MWKQLELLLVANAGSILYAGIAVDWVCKPNHVRFRERSFIILCVVRHYSSFPATVAGVCTPLLPNKSATVTDHRPSAPPPLAGTGKWSVHGAQGALLKGSYGHSSVWDADSGLVYVYGGHLSDNIATYSLSNLLHSLDPETMKW